MCLRDTYGVVMREVSITQPPHSLTVLVKNLQTLLLDIVVDESREEIGKCLKDPGLLCSKLVLHNFHIY